MPSFTMHIAVAKQYMKKHEFEITNEEDFIKGSIAPDLEDDFKTISKHKDETHYSKWCTYPVNINYNKFLNEKKVNINLDFWKGYLLHLITDEAFYNDIFLEETKTMFNNNDNFYNDYSCLNKHIIENYNIEIIDDLEKYMSFKNGEPKYLKQDKIIRFIEQISDLSLKEEIEKRKELYI